MKRFTVGAAIIFLVAMAFLACWRFSRSAPHASPAASNLRRVPAAAIVAAALTLEARGYDWLSEPTAAPAGATS